MNKPKRFIAVCTTAIISLQAASEGGVVAALAFTDLSDDVFTVTLSGSATMGSSPSLDAWDYGEFEQFEWRAMSRDAGVNLFTTGGDARNVEVSNSTARASVGSEFVTVSHLDLGTFGSTRNDFGFSFDGNPAFSAGDVVEFSGSFDFSIDGVTAADFNEGTWSEDDGIYWTNDFVSNDQGLQLSISQVPEPSNFALIFALISLAWVGGKRTRPQKSVG